jgi:hypothetical protein
MNGYYQNSINLFPPQIYELCRLANFQKLSNFIEYLTKCQNDPEHRIKRMLGIVYKIPEAIIIVWHGDDYYPSDASFTSPVVSSNKTLKDFDSKNQNRLIMMNKKDHRIWEVHYKNENEKSNFYIKPLTNRWSKL